MRTQRESERNRSRTPVEAEARAIWPSLPAYKAHIAGGNWQGKAGAYGIQETGDDFVERIDGSFTNVMGLPMERTARLLKKEGITPQTDR